MNKVKTDNSFIEEKIYLRIKYLPNKEFLNILDCFHGKGIIWNNIKNITNQKINITGIEKKYNKSKNNDFVIYGDCLKYLKKMDLSCYDVIDLDCYGSPSKYLYACYKNKTLRKDVVIYYTNINSIYGYQTEIVLKSNKISKNMYNKCITIFNKKRLYFFYNFLYNLGIRKVMEIQKNHKFYGVINPE